MLTLFMCLFGTPALAQDSDAQVYAEPSERQIQLNEQAVRALADGDAIKAVSLLEESNYLGELNVTYLNLGRSYQQLGKCEQAREAFKMVFEAPEVETPPPGFVKSKAQSYLDELEQSCDAEEQASSGEATDDASAPAEDDSDTDAAADADPVDPDEAVIPGEDVEATSPPTSSSNTTGIVLLGAGAALMAGGVATHFVAEGQRAPLRDPETNADGHVDSLSQQEALDAERRADTLEIAAISAGAAGLAVAGLGAVLLLSGGESEGPGQTQWMLTPTRNGWAIGLQQRF